MSIKTAVEQEYATVAQAAAECGVTVSKVWNWIYSPNYKLPVEKVMGVTVVTRADLDAFKAAHPQLVKAATRKGAKKLAA